MPPYHAFPLFGEFCCISYRLKHTGLDFCDGLLKLIASIEDPTVIVKILAHPGMPTKAPPRAPARASLFSLISVAVREAVIVIVDKYALLSEQEALGEQL
jgi:hypothetical protein